MQKKNLYLNDNYIYYYSYLNLPCQIISYNVWYLKFMFTIFLTFINGLIRNSFCKKIKSLKSPSKSNPLGYTLYRNRLLSSTMRLMKRLFAYFTSASESDVTQTKNKPTVFAHSRSSCFEENKSQSGSNGCLQLWPTFNPSVCLELPMHPLNGPELTTYNDVPVNSPEGAVTAGKQPAASSAAPFEQSVAPTLIFPLHLFVTPSSEA